MPRTDLRELLGDERFNEAMSAMSAASDGIVGPSLRFFATGWVTAMRALLPDLLADAWREGYAQAVADHLLRYDNSADTPNPYRAAHAAAHSAAQGVPASQCGPDAARPADGIVGGTHYGTEGGER